MVSIWLQDTGYTHVEASARASPAEGSLIFILCIAIAPFTPTSSRVTIRHVLQVRNCQLYYDTMGSNRQEATASGGGSKRSRDAEGVKWEGESKGGRREVVGSSRRKKENAVSSANEIRYSFTPPPPAVPLIKKIEVNKLIQITDTRVV